MAFLPASVARTVRWTKPTIAATFAAFLLGNLFANFLFVVALIVALMRWFDVPLIYATPLLAIYYGHVALQKAHVRGWSGKSAVGGFFKRLVLAGGVLSHYFDFNVIIERDEKDNSKNIREGKRYLFGYGHHGIHGFGTGIFMDPNGPFFKAFPFLKDKIVGLGANVLFWIPLVRELFLLVGWRDASRHVAERALIKENKSIYIILGGEAEALLSEPGTDKVVLAGKKRQGFVRLALSTGSQLVPTYCLHNTDTYCTIPWLYGFRKWLSKKYQICIPLFYGRFFTPLPFNVRLTVAVGKPIPWPAGYNEAEVLAAVAKGEKYKPSDEMVESLHQAYIEALKGLFERHKKEAGYPDSRKLEICES
jgi:Diacylglycerol acyltransferase